VLIRTLIFFYNRTKKKEETEVDSNPCGLTVCGVYEPYLKQLKSYRLDEI
jgi:hypothetical protein